MVLVYNVDIQGDGGTYNIKKEKGLVQLVNVVDH